MIRRVAFCGIFVIAVAATSLRAPRRLRWCVYYSDQAPISAFDGFDLIVLDSDQHPPLRALLTRPRTLLGYLSLGEVEDYRSYFAEVAAEGLLIRENQNWKGSFFLDLRDDRWADRVVNRLIPAIIRRGFHGVFLDTLDNAAALERLDPRKYAGMTEAAAKLVRRIRRSHPGIKIMLNRAYEILPQVEQEIDFVLGESVCATYDFSRRTYRWVTREDYNYQVKLLREAMARRPTLDVLTLDYWDPNDPDGIRRIYRLQRANGFAPYVSTIALDHIVKEP